MSYLIKSYINRSHSGDKNMTSRLCLSGGHVTKLSFQTESPMFAGQSTSGTKRKENSMEYFVKIPNNFIKCDIEKDFDVTPSFYVVYYLLNNNRNIRNQSFISIKEIIHTQKNTWADILAVSLLFSGLKRLLIKLQERKLLLGKVVRQMQISGLEIIFRRRFMTDISYYLSKKIQFIQM